MIVDTALNHGHLKDWLYSILSWTIIEYLAYCMDTLRLSDLGLKDKLLDSPFTYRLVG